MCEDEKTAATASSYFALHYFASFIHVEYATKDPVQTYRFSLLSLLSGSHCLIEALQEVDYLKQYGIVSSVLHNEQGQGEHDESK